MKAKQLANLSLGAICTFFTISALAGPWTPRVDRREANQERRIEQGVRSGALSPGEARRLEAQQERIERAEGRAKADGVVTGRERTHLENMQNRASRNIYRKKHNWR